MTNEHLEESLWSIHKHIDFITEATRLQDTILKIPHKYIVNNHSGFPIMTGIKSHTYMKQGYVYAPYVPMMPIPDIWKDEYKRRDTTIGVRMSDKIRKMFNKIK